MKRPILMLAAATMAAAAWTAPSALACSSDNASISEIEEALKSGYFLDRQGEYAQAIDTFKKVLADHPDNRKAHYFLANTYWRDNNYNMARREWEAVLRMQPNDREGREAREWLSQNGTMIKWGPKVQTVSGGEAGFMDGPMAQARFHNPGGMVLSQTGNLYIADTGNKRLRRVTPDGTVMTVAGNGMYGYLDGDARDAQLEAPEGLALDPVGNLYFGDGHRVRFLTPEGQVGTLAGLETSGMTDGDHRTATFTRPTALTTDKRGNVYVADNGTAIRMIRPNGEVRLLAGSSLGGYQDGAREDVRFKNITALRWTPEDILIVLDAGNNRLRAVSATGEVKSLPGCSNKGYVDGPIALAHFGTLEGMAIDAKGNLLLADAGNFAIRRVNENLMVETIAGGAGGGSVDGLGISAKFRQPTDLAVWNNTVYVLDRKQHAIRKITLSPQDG